MGAGILGYGVYVPRYRISSEEYKKAVGAFARMVKEKAVAAYDEDAITMGVEAAVNAIKHAGIKSDQVDAIYFASTSPPYAEKLISSTVSTALNLNSKTRMIDMGSSTKAGVSALIACIDFILSGQGSYGLMIASDCPLARIGYGIEHGLGAGAAAFVISRNDAIAEFENAYSNSREVLGERFRRSGEKFINDLEIRGYENAAFTELTTSTINGLLSKLRMMPKDVNYLAIHQSDIRSTYRVAKTCGFTNDQVTPGIVSSNIGDAGASTVLIGLAAILEKVKADERIIVVSYGSGAGSDAASFRIKQTVKKRKNESTLRDYLINKKYIDFLSYLKIKKMINT